MDVVGLDSYPSCWSCNLDECTGTNGEYVAYVSHCLNFLASVDGPSADNRFLRSKYKTTTSESTTAPSVPLSVLTTTQLFRQAIPVSLHFKHYTMMLPNPHFGIKLTTLQHTAQLHAGAPRW